MLPWRVMVFHLLFPEHLVGPQSIKEYQGSWESHEALTLQDTSFPPSAAVGRGWQGALLEALFLHLFIQQIQLATIPSIWGYSGE